VLTGVADDESGESTKELTKQRRLCGERANLGYCNCGDEPRDALRHSYNAYAHMLSVINLRRSN